MLCLTKTDQTNIVFKQIDKKVGSFEIHSSSTIKNVDIYCWGTTGITFVRFPVIIIKINSHPSGKGDRNRFWLSCCSRLVFSLPKTFKLHVFGYKIFSWLLAYLMMVIPGTYLMMVIPGTYLMMVIPGTYLMMVIPGTRRAHYI